LAGISIREFARREKCDDKLVRRAITKERLKANVDGSLDEGLVGSGWRKANRADTADKPSADTSKGVRTAVEKGRQQIKREGQVPADDISSLADFIDQTLRGEFAPQAIAEKVKENALALKHLLEGRQKAGELVPIETAERVLFETQRAQRDAWLEFPVKVSPLIAADLNVDPDRLMELLAAHVNRQCNDLGDPEADFGTGGGTA
jgi:hypothetical protein